MCNNVALSSYDTLALYFGQALPNKKQNSIIWCTQRRVRYIAVTIKKLKLSNEFACLLRNQLIRTEKLKEDNSEKEELNAIY